MADRSDTIVASWDAAGGTADTAPSAGGGGGCGGAADVMAGDDDVDDDVSRSVGASRESTYASNVGKAIAKSSSKRSRDPATCTSGSWSASGRSTIISVSTKWDECGGEMEGGRPKAADGDVHRRHGDCGAGDGERRRMRRRSSIDGDGDWSLATLTGVDLVAGSLHISRAVPAATRARARLRADSGMGMY